MLLIKLCKQKSASAQTVSISNLYLHNVCLVRERNQKKEEKS